MKGEVEGRTPGAVEHRERFRPAHALGVVAAGVVVVVVAYLALHALAGIIIGLVEAVVVVAVIATLLWLVFGRRRR